ncbi:MAG: DUF459 domain-containing protein [Dehalococcoidia bacterium]|nr:DUF459 domain-containing protein [Dehalococcoidia bacterium]
MKRSAMVAMEPEPVEEQGLRVRAGRVLAVIAGALFIALLLNASELEREAKAKPLGTERDVWVGIWKPFATVSRSLYLDRPRAWADDALDRGGTGDVFELPPATATVAATPTAPAQLVRTPSAEEPLRIWIGGDSMMKVLGESFVREAGGSGLFDPVHEPQLESGLTRPDFFDWPRELNRLASVQPRYDVFVVMFGANDAQGIIEPNGTIHQVEGSAGWVAEYRRRVAGVMDLLRADGRLVVWVGQPVMRSDGLSDDMAMMNQVYREEAASRPWVRFVDLWPLFVDSEGDYNAYIADDDGETRLMRNPDGVHFVREGGDRAARAILKVIRAEAKVD